MAETLLLVWRLCLCAKLNRCARFAAFSPRKPTPGFLGAAARGPAAQGRNFFRAFTAGLRRLCSLSLASASALKPCPDTCSQSGCGIARYEKNQMWCGGRCGTPPQVVAPLRCARAYGVRKDIFLSLPSAYPFSAQARLGPRWANLSSRLRRFTLVAMTGSLTLCESMVVPCYVSRRGCGIVRYDKNQMWCGERW